MELGIDNNLIILKIGKNTSLKKYQASQLHFYGYMRNDSLFTKLSDNIPNDLKTITNYFDIENLNYASSDEIVKILESAHSIQVNFEKLKLLGKKIKEGKIDSDSFKQFVSFANTLPRKLKSHQIKAAFHLYSIKNGANFSVPGSGKTSVVLTVYEKLRSEGLCNVVFIAGPPSSFQPWQNEFIETLGREPNAIILSGGNKELRKSEYYKFPENSEMYLSSFQTIMNDYRDLINFLRQNELNAFMVIDEAHYMKQLGGSWANALLKTSEVVDFKCVLTGTPIPKSYQDLFNLFEFLMPNQGPLSDSDKIEINILEKKNKYPDIKSLLHDRIGPFFYRVRKKDLGLIPAIFHDPILVKMNRVELKIYELIKSRIFELSKNEFIENSELLSSLWRGRMIRMRQAVSYPRLLVTAIQGYNEELMSSKPELYKAITEYDKIEIPGKLESLTSLVQMIKDKHLKVVIWSNFVGSLKLIKSHFTKKGWRSELIYGGTPRRGAEHDSFEDEITREAIRDRFVDSKSGLDILIANPAACAESISLHKTCFNAIYYDLSYNCAQYLQSLDRIHRVGGSEDQQANYYFLQYENSLDQDIKENLNTKAERMYGIIEKDYEIYNLDLYEEAIDDEIEAYKRLFTNNN